MKNNLKNKNNIDANIEQIKKKERTTTRFIVATSIIIGILLTFLILGLAK